MENLLRYTMQMSFEYTYKIIDRCDKLKKENIKINMEIIEDIMEDLHCCWDDLLETDQMKIKEKIDN